MCTYSFIAFIIDVGEASSADPTRYVQSSNCLQVYLVAWQVVSEYVRRLCITYEHAECHTSAHAKKLHGMLFMQKCIACASPVRNTPPVASKRTPM